MHRRDPSGRSKFSSFAFVDLIMTTVRKAENPKGLFVFAHSLSDPRRIDTGSNLAFAIGTVDIGSRKSVVSLFPFSYRQPYHLGINNRTKAFHQTPSILHQYQRLSPPYTKSLLRRILSPFLNILTFKQKFDSVIISRQIFITGYMVNNRMTWPSSNRFRPSQNPHEW